MYMHPYFIQYSSIYPSYGASQRPIVASNNLVKSKPDCSKEGEKDIKARQQVFTAEVVPFRLVSHPKEKAVADAQEGVYGTASGGCTSKVGDHEAGIEA